MAADALENLPAFFVLDLQVADLEPCVQLGTHRRGDVVIQVVHLAVEREKERVVHLGEDVGARQRVAEETEEWCERTDRHALRSIDPVLLLRGLDFAPLRRQDQVVVDELPIGLREARQPDRAVCLKEHTGQGRKVLLIVLTEALFSSASTPQRSDHEKTGRRIGDRLPYDQQAPARPSDFLLDHRQKP